ncbi:uncharacterized protein LOC144873500 [Branchiostoma floridae x Branchiostoma japonicum]
MFARLRRKGRGEFYGGPIHCARPSLLLLGRRFDADTSRYIFLEPAQTTTTKPLSNRDFLELHYSSVKFQDEGEVVHAINLESCDTKQLHDRHSILLCWLHEFGGLDTMGCTAKTVGSKCKSVVTQYGKLVKNYNARWNRGGSQQWKKLQEFLDADFTWAGRTPGTKLVKHSAVSKRATPYEDRNPPMTGFVGFSKETTLALLPRMHMEELQSELNRRNIVVKVAGKHQRRRGDLEHVLREVMTREYEVEEDEGMDTSNTSSTFEVYHSNTSSTIEHGGSNTSSTFQLVTRDVEAEEGMGMDTSNNSSTFEHCCSNTSSALERGSWLKEVGPSSCRQALSRPNKDQASSENLPDLSENTEKDGMSSRQAADISKSKTHTYPGQVQVKKEPVKYDSVILDFDQYTFQSNSVAHVTEPSTTQHPGIGDKSQPNSVSSQPISASLQPNSASLQPNSATSQPTSATSQPNSATSQPNSATSQPNSATSQPNSATSQPNSATSQPNSASSKPNSATSQNLIVKIKTEPGLEDETEDKQLQDLRSELCPSFPGQLSQELDKVNITLKEEGSQGDVPSSKEPLKDDPRMSADPVVLDHMRNISKMCRICGQAVLTCRDKLKMLRANSCREYAGKIHEVWGVDVTKDRSYIHPPCFCLRCRAKMYRSPKLKRAKVVTWYDHDAFEGNSCAHCEKIASLSKGGRPVKKKSTGRPRSQVKQEQQRETTMKIEEDPLDA